MITGCGLPGCGPQRPTLVPVSGQVTIDGKPLARGFVRFIPTEGRPAGGKIESDGKFILSTYKEGDGASLGSHRVQVTSVEPVDERAVRWLVPKKYADAQSSGLSATIDKQTDDLQIELSWDGKAPYLDR
jgi:hypothetical protein